MGTQNQSKRTDIQTFQITISERSACHMHNRRRVFRHLGRDCYEQDIPHG